MISELPVVSVHIPPGLRALVGGSAEVMGSGETVGEVLDALGSRYPHWRAHLFRPDGGLADGVAVFLGARSLAGAEGLATPVDNAECINVFDSRPPVHEDDLPPLAAHAVAHDISIGD